MDKELLKEAFKAGSDYQYDLTADHDDKYKGQPISFEAWYKSKAENGHISDVSVTAWVFDGKDTNGRDISIYIEAPDRESAIAYFESDYEGYRYWQTRQLHSR